MFNPGTAYRTQPKTERVRMIAEYMTKVTNNKGETMGF